VGTPGVAARLEAAALPSADADEAASAAVDGDAGLRWLPATVTWRDGVGSDDRFVARVDLGVLAPAVRVRVRDDDVAGLRALTWEAVVPAAPARSTGLTTTEPAVRQAALDGFEPRSAWGARAPSGCSSNPTKTKVTVHHTVSALNDGGTRDEFAATLRGIQSLHMDGRGYCDVGYHFLVTADGTVWEARSAAALGAHTGSQNTDNLGISFVGCFHPTSACSGLGSTTPPTAMIDGAGAFLGLVIRHYGITLRPGSTYFGHRDNPGQATACPGDVLHDALPTLQAIAEGGAGPGATGRVQGIVWNLALTTDIAQVDATGARLPGTVVTATQDDVEVATATARDGDAYWRLDLAPGRYTIATSLDGFAPATRTLDIAAGDDRWSSLGIAPATAAVAVTVTVVDDTTAAPVPQARVAFGPVPPPPDVDEFLPVDADGAIVASFAPGPLPVRVRAEGYADHDEVLTVVAGTPLSATIRLAVSVVEEPAPDDEPPPPVPDEDGVDRIVIRNRAADDSGGCSCTSAAPGAPYAALVLVLGAWRGTGGRRRRRTHDG
jgi:hypothetical protein